MAPDDRDESQLQSPAYPGSGHETRDISLRPLILFVIGLTSGLAVILLGVRGQFYLYEIRPSPGQQMPAPLPPIERSPTAAPKLQEVPEADMDRLRAEYTAALRSEGWVDRKAGTVRISIDDAMKILAAKGLPARKTPAPPDPSAKGGRR